jgi:hypothetical protein
MNEEVYRRIYNNTSEEPNRAYEIATKEGDGKPISITLLDIDTAVIEFLRNTVKPMVTHEDGLIAGPVIYGDPEKWQATQQQGESRDVKGKIQTPLIMLKRTEVERDKERNSPVNRYLNKTESVGWNKKIAYDKFSAINGIVPSKQLVTTVIPDYVDLTYDTTAWTESNAQLNEIIEQINFATDEYWGPDNSFKFRATIDLFSQTTENPAEEDRIIKSNFPIKVSAYLLPERMTERGKIVPTSRTTYTAKKVVINEFISK